VFKTPRNIFGLWRKYYTKQRPSHDPEMHITLDDLVDETISDNILPGTDNRIPAVNAFTADDSAPTMPTPNTAQNIFHPYPNKSSFRLGEWFWGNGAQKSRESFHELLSIVGDQDFRPKDVRQTKWQSVDDRLAVNEFDVEDGKDEGEWMDEEAGWKRTPVKISVPFHGRTENPGPQDFVIGDLYHRSLVSVIEEKLANTEDVQHFHYEPFELYWKPTDTSDDIRVHGELYTSPAFLDADSEIQEAPGEPGCNLQRVVVAMMFSSDATHLTSFGNAKLWPCYLFFGNESKDRRAKPKCHLCHHVAYFQAVSTILLFPSVSCILTVLFSFPMHSKTSQIKTWVGKVLVIHS
jgi:hypothetical protein